MRATRPRSSTTFAFDEEVDRRAGARDPRGRRRCRCSRSASSARPENLSTDRRDRGRLRRGPAGRLHARPVVVERRSDRPLPRRVSRTDAAADHGVGRKPQHAVALAAARLEQRAQPDARATSPRRPRELGVPYTLVTGIPLPDQFIDNVLASPQAVLGSEKFERFEAVFSGAGDTLSAALAALLASGTDLVAASTEALSYLDRCLDAGFRPGMGHVVPDRLFWAQPEGEDEELTEEEREGLCRSSTCPPMTPNTDLNQPLFERAQQVIPGGVNSPVRAFRAVGGTPRFVQARAGRLFLGRQRPALHRLHRLLGPDDPGPRPSGRASKRCRRPCWKAFRSARRPSARSNWPRKSSRLVPSMEMVRLVSSGTEAAMSAHPAGARRHRPQQVHQVRRLLPRPCRRAAGQGRLGPGDLRQPDQRRRAARGGAAHAGPRIQQRRSSSKKPSRCTARNWPA